VSVQRWKKRTTPILLPERVPAHWPDAAHLRSVGHQHLGDNKPPEVEPHTVL